MFLVDDNTNFVKPTKPKAEKVTTKVVSHVKLVKVDGQVSATTAKKLPAASQKFEEAVNAFLESHGDSPKKLEQMATLVESMKDCL